MNAILPLPSIVAPDIPLTPRTITGSPLMTMSC